MRRRSHVASTFEREDHRRRSADARHGSRRGGAAAAPVRHEPDLRIAGKRSFDTVASALRGVGSGS
jgi:hypothetical protein